MKVIQTSLLFTLMIFILAGCLDSGVPSNRPVFVKDNTTGGDATPKTPEKLPIPVRPTLSVVMQSDHCGCKDGKPVTIGNCVNICSAKPSSPNEILYFNTKVTTAISADIYKDVGGWCSEEIIDPNTKESTTPGTVSCYIETKDQNGVKGEITGFTPAKGVSGFSIDIGTLSYSKTYRLTIVERSSGARSTTFQVTKFKTSTNNTVKGPLALMPVTQYSCINKTNVVDDGTGQVGNIANAQRMHFYFVAETRPEPLPEVSNFYCHDIQTKGPTPINSPLLEEDAGAFTVWNRMDPRFFDQNQDEKADINNIIEDYVVQHGQTLSATPDIFHQLKWVNGVTTGTSTPQQLQLGWYMTPWIDGNTYKAYCPTQQHYYSNNLIFKAMRETVGTDTEALYVAKQNNVCDLLLVKESIVKKIWFYKENDQHITPNDTTIVGKQIQFYWPADPNSPHIKKSHQKIYTIKGSNELGCAADTGLSVNTGAQNSGGLSSTYPPHDKRIGCIPKLTN